jgi:hypothetical protein
MRLAVIATVSAVLAASAVASAPVVQDDDCNCQRCSVGLFVYRVCLSGGQKLSGRLANPRSTIPGAG